MGDKWCLNSSKPPFYPSLIISYHVWILLHCHLTTFINLLITSLDKILQHNILSLWVPSVPWTTPFFGTHQCLDGFLSQKGQESTACEVSSLTFPLEKLMSTFWGETTIQLVGSSEAYGAWNLRRVLMPSQHQRHQQALTQ